MDIQTTLTWLGVRDDTLTQAEKDQLDRDGYLPLPNILTPEQVYQCGQRLDALLQQEGAEAGKEVHQETGTDRLADLINKDPIFDLCFTNPRVLAAISHVLKGDMKLSSLNFRSALPGSGLQALHCDWKEAVAPGDFYACNSIWLLDDFTEENGATRVVPGSHMMAATPQEKMDDPTAPHPDQRLLLAPAGTVVVFNSHTWHGGTLNRSGQRRRGMHCYFSRRDQPQQLDQRQYVRPETRERLSPAARFLLDV